MAESIIFHFIIILFIVVAFVWGLMTKIKLELIQKSLIPLLLLSEIEGRRHRSLVVRCLPYLKKQLCEIFECEVDFNLTTWISNKSLIVSANFILPICYLMEKQNFNEKVKIFLIDQHLFFSSECASYVKLIKNKNKIIFQYDCQQNIWNVEIIYEI